MITTSVMIHAALDRIPEVAQAITYWDNVMRPRGVSVG